MNCALVSTSTRAVSERVQSAARLGLTQTNSATHLSVQHRRQNIAARGSWQLSRECTSCATDCCSAGDAGLTIAGLLTQACTICPALWWWHTVVRVSLECSNQDSGTWSLSHRRYRHRGDLQGIRHCSCLHKDTASWTKQRLHAGASKTKVLYWWWHMARQAVAATSLLAQNVA